VAGLSDGDVIDALVENVLQTSFSSLDKATVDWAKVRIADVIGCIVGGARAEGNRELAQLLSQWGGRQEATILIYGGKVPTPSAAMANSVMARSFDFGPVEPLLENIGIPGHLSETTVPTALAVGEWVQADGREVITSLVVGEDLACRVLVAGGYDFDQGWDCIGTVNALGATATAGRLLGLNARQLKNALGIALNQLAGSVQNYWDAAMSFKLLQGLSARNGIFSAELARTGWTGLKNAITGPYGYYALFNRGRVDRELLLRNLGRNFYTDSVIKPYPCCRLTHGAVDCALDLVDKYAIRPEQIERVVIHLTRRCVESFVAQPFRVGQSVHPSAIFSYRYTVATALARGHVWPEDFLEEAVFDPRVRVVADAIVLTKSPRVQGLGAEVEVQLKDGRTLREATPVPRGDRVASPLSREQIEAKFMHNFAFGGLDAETAQSVLKLCENFEELNRVTTITELLNR